MSETPAAPSGARALLRRLIVFVIGFAVSLGIGWAAERMTDADTLASAVEAQQGWIEATAETSTIAVATTYVQEFQAALTGEPVVSDGFASPRTKQSLMSAPFVALALSGARFLDAGGIAAMVQLALGALAFVAFNLVRTRGEDLLFGNFALNLILGPVLVVFAASVIGLVLQGVMLGALFALSWVTGLAAAAAGATGVVGFCWFCLTKLGEKGAEHALTPKT